MTEPQREPGVYEAMQLQAATQRAMRDIYTERPDPLASIPAEAREAIAAWLEAEYDQIADDSRRYAELSAITDEAKDEVWGTLAHQYLRPLAAALRRVGDE